MKALSIQQPWAWAIVFGPKAIENRSRRFHYRGPLLIHASKSRARLGDWPAPLDQLEFGCLIGLVDLVDCVPVEQVRGEPFAEGPQCLILKNPRPFPKAIRWRGGQALFNVPEEQIEGALASVGWTGGILAGTQEGAGVVD
jgi:hypothetical protein